MVVKYDYDPLDAGGVAEARKIVPRPRDAKGRYVSTIFGKVQG
jgi:hypothetical protein